ncbi:MAG: copper homeostasis protein CutC [Planctomycetota bacterium]|nr:copper homeostasis protein CutC [Planctomycetota bacterium]MDA1114563.1 copper homeostasis protein CutC [Planctomycetota bacterium]
MKFEVCTETLAGAIAAQEGGAHRIELCAQLDLDGLTPSGDLLLAVKEAVDIPILCMARPCGGSFHIGEEVFEALLEQAIRLKALGADGLVVGMLTSDGAVDVQQLKRLMQVADGLPVTFHRALDYTVQVEEALEVLIAHGVKRVLTSGCRGNAEQGTKQLKKLVEQAAGRIAIVVGGGVRAHNVRLLQETTGANEFHSALDRNPTKGSVKAWVKGLST